MSEIERIRNLENYDFSKYANVSSREKLVAYVIRFLNKEGIRTTFNNVCITSFKLFPEKFYFSEDFPEYPHIEMLNRTLLHLRPKERDYATGSARQDYALTKLGEEIAKIVEDEINNVTDTKKVKKEVMDKHKNTSSSEYQRLIESKEYQEYCECGIVEANMIWNFFEVTPHTQIDHIKKYLNSVKSYCEQESDEKCLNFITSLLPLVK